MRDHTLKNEVGRIEDELQKLSSELDQIAFKAQGAGAEGHAEFYWSVMSDIGAALNDIEDAYSKLLNGDEELGVEALADEVEVRQ